MAKCGGSVLHYVYTTETLPQKYKYKPYNESDSLNFRHKILQDGLIYC